MENNETTPTEATEKKEQSFVLTSTRHTHVSFKTVPLKLRLKALIGGNIWVTTIAQIQIKQETEPIPVTDGIEIFINAKKPQNEK